MAIVATGTRIHDTFSSRETRAFVKYALTGTYATGGFTTPFSSVTAGPGTSAFVSKNPIAFQWFSPTGYLYVSTITFSGGIPTVTTKIFSAPGTELANTTAVPDASILAAIDMQKY
jgi:hypothetical protein